ncbi:hypothetical protein [Corynebacterium cystitidis]|nr:hypothetical protein [Corynebacterium cystitidis]
MKSEQLSDSPPPAPRVTEPTDWWSKRFGLVAQILTWIALSLAASFLSGFPMVDFFRLEILEEPLQPISHQWWKFVAFVATFMIAGLLAHTCVPGQHRPTVGKTVGFFGIITLILITRNALRLSQTQNPSVFWGFSDLAFWFSSVMLIFIWILAFTPKQAKGSTLEHVLWHNARVKNSTRGIPSKTRWFPYVSAVLLSFILAYGPIFEIGLESSVEPKPLFWWNVSVVVFLALAAATWGFIIQRNRTRKRVIAGSDKELKLTIKLFFLSSLLTSVGWLLPEKTSLVHLSLSLVWFLVTTGTIATVPLAIDRQYQILARYKPQKDGKIYYSIDGEPFLILTPLRGTLETIPCQTKHRIKERIYLKILDHELTNSHISFLLETNSSGLIHIKWIVLSTNQHRYLVYGPTETRHLLRFKIAYLFSYFVWLKPSTEAPICVKSAPVGPGAQPIIITPHDVKVDPPGLDASTQSDPQV